MIANTSYTSALSPEYALLGLLAVKPTYGYELHQRFMAELGQVWHISLSHTYNILNRLEERGYINGALEEQSKLPDRRMFRITPSGRKRFETWLYKPSGCSVRAIRVEFTTRLYFAYHTNPQFAYHLIEEQASEINLGIERLQSMLAKTPPGKLFNRLGLDLRLRQLVSILEWLADCQSALQSELTIGELSQ